jgi:hypothetical protein
MHFWLIFEFIKREWVTRKLILMLWSKTIEDASSRREQKEDNTIKPKDETKEIPAETTTDGTDREMTGGTIAEIVLTMTIEETETETTQNIATN